MNLSLTLVVPVFNEQESIDPFVNEVQQCLKSLIKNNRLKIIFVDDGSGDLTWMRIIEQCKNTPWISGIRLAFNCGSHVAIRAGLDSVSSDICVCIAVDLEDPVQAIESMMEEIKKGSKIVWGARSNQHRTNFLDIVGSKLYYQGLKIGGMSKVPALGASMIMMTKEVVSIVNSYRDKGLVLEVALSILEVPQTVININRTVRRKGISRWSLSKKAKLFIDGLLGFTMLPSRILTFTGLGLWIFGTLSSCYLIISRLLNLVDVPGWTSIVVIILFLMGLNFLFLGVIAEYLYRILDETRKRPLYHIREVVNSLSVN